MLAVGLYLLLASFGGVMPRQYVSEAHRPTEPGAVLGIFLLFTGAPLAYGSYKALGPGATAYSVEVGTGLVARTMKRLFLILLVFSSVMGGIWLAFSSGDHLVRGGGVALLVFGLVMFHLTAPRRE